LKLMKSSSAVSCVIQLKMIGFPENICVPIISI
jgi:hypothetical protein